MGCNAIRTAHNPAAPAFLDLCDEMGFMVIEEAFDEWRDGKTPFGYQLDWDEWWERDLADMIRRRLEELHEPLVQAREVRRGAIELLLRDVQRVEVFTHRRQCLDGQRNPA